MRVQTIPFKGVSLEVYFSQTKPEARTHEYPGSEASVSIHSVELAGVDIMSLVEHDIDKIEETLSDYIN